MTRKIRTFSNDHELVEERRKEIIRCASRVFIQNGYENTGMREIARSFGKSTGSLYHYVGSKQDILYLILNYVISNQQEFLRKINNNIVGMTTTDALKEAINVFVRELDAFADMYIFVNHVMVSLSKTERAMMQEASLNAATFFEELIQRGINDGSFKTIDPRMVAWDITVVASGWVNRRWFWSRNTTLPQFIQRQTELILKMLV